MILKQAPFPGAVDTCKALVEAGHKLIYISNRATETEEATTEWLSKNGFLTDDLATRVVITTGDKRPFIKEAQYIIDDRLKTCVEFVYDFEWQSFYGERGYIKGPTKKERAAFVLKYPYNQNATDIPGLYVAPTWAGLNVYMHRRGLLPELAVAAMA
jgi:predicted secreted acid phosphatase